MADGRRDIDKAICALVVLFALLFFMVFQLGSQKSRKRRQNYEFRSIDANDTTHGLQIRTANNRLLFHISRNIQLLLSEITP